jgi:glycerol kinase
MRETTALGAAIAAGLAVGLWRNFAELRDINRAGGAVFEPQIPPEKSAEMFGLWEKAVHMSEGWVSRNKEKESSPVKRVAAVVNGGTTVAPAISNGHVFDNLVFDDLDEADEEDLLLELRKIEIHQRLKKLRLAKNHQKKV